MSVYSLLTEQDKELITEYVKVYASSGSNEITIDPKIALQEWDVNKSQYLSQLFGGHELILKKKYHQELTQEELLDYYQEESEKFEGSVILDRIKNAIWDILSKTTAKNKNEILAIVRSLFSEKNIINNLYSGEQINIKFLDGSSYRITPKSKLLRIINYIGKKDKDNLYQEDITNFINWCSQLRNQKLIDGELCISIHPLDFFTLSDNASGWSSCISWYNQDNEIGERRAGTLECLNSPRVIVAYLNNLNHPFEFSPGKFWNNKQWRELFIVDKSLISEIKAYPYQNKTLTEEILAWLKDLAKTNLNWEYLEPIDLAIGHIELPNESIHIMPTTKYFMYNDFGRLKSHQGFVNYLNIVDELTAQENGYMVEEYIDNSKWHTHKFLNFQYGGKTTCLKCGRTFPEKDKYKDRVICNDCEPGFKCAYCRKWINNNKTFYNIDEPICEDCYLHNTFIDALTGKKYMEDNMIKLYWEDSEGNSSENYITIQDPGFYDKSDIYWEIFSEYPNLYYGNEYYITLDSVKDISRFMELFELEENPFI